MWCRLLVSKSLADAELLLAMVSSPLGVTFLEGFRGSVPFLSFSVLQSTPQPDSRRSRVYCCFHWVQSDHTVEKTKDSKYFKQIDFWEQETRDLTFTNIV